MMVFAALLSLIAGFGMMAGMRGWEIAMWAIGTCLVVGLIIFTFFEVRRLAGISLSSEQLARDEAEADRMTVVVVEGPTGDPVPHHEDYVESAGFDQGQLTSRTPEGTPFIEDFLNRWRKAERRRA
ncbi:MAG TPA: hypothetical protein VEV37_06580 [Bryobacteraceae bacterium]|nr:hypothetical protein [Bryobacteraceae bacterium]